MQITQWCKNPDPDPEPNWNQCRSTTMLVSESIIEFGKQNWMTNTGLSSIIFKIKFCGIMGWRKQSAGIATKEEALSCTIHKCFGSALVSKRVAPGLYLNVDPNRDRSWDTDPKCWLIFLKIPSSITFIRSRPRVSAVWQFFVNIFVLFHRDNFTKSRRQNYPTIWTIYEA